MRRSRSPSAGSPGVGEGAAHLGHRWATNLDTGVTPGGPAALRRALPHLANAEPGNECDLAVDDEAFAVVAPDPAQRLVQARRVVAPDVHPLLAQPAPEPAGCLAQGAEPVVDDPDGHALTRFLDEGGGKALPRVVVVNDVVLEVYAAPRRSDRSQPGGVVLRGVAQDTHGVPPHQGRAGSPREKLIAKRSHGLGVGHGPLLRRETLSQSQRGRQRTASASLGAAPVEIATGHPPAGGRVRALRIVAARLTAAGDPALGAQEGAAAHREDEAAAVSARSNRLSGVELPNAVVRSDGAVGLQALETTSRAGCPTSLRFVASRTVPSLPIRTTPTMPGSRTKSSK
jgi:hypothetical protein